MGRKRFVFQTFQPTKLKSLKYQKNFNNISPTICGGDKELFQTNLEYYFSAITACAEYIID